MDQETLTQFIRQLHEELRAIDRVIENLARLMGKPKRGRPRKYLSPLARTIARGHGQKKPER